MAQELLWCLHRRPRRDLLQPLRALEEALIWPRRGWPELWLELGGFWIWPRMGWVELSRVLEEFLTFHLFSM